MDCLFCCSESTHIISNMMTEAWRTLKPGGLFMTISLHEEEKVLPYIQLDDVSYRADLVTIPNSNLPTGTQYYFMTLNSLCADQAEPSRLEYTILDSL